MTQVNSEAGVPRAVDTDRIDGGGASVRPAVACLLAGAVVGSVIGGVYGAGKPMTYRAETALSVLPDAAVSGQILNGTTTSPSQDATAFIQSELVVLNGSQLRDQVQRTLRLPAAPEVSSTQVGQTYVVDVTATAGSRDAALAIATATGNAYATGRRAQLAGDVNVAIASVQKQLAAVQASLAAAGGGPPGNNNSQPAGSALGTEYQRLLAVNSSLQLSSGQVGRAVSTVSPASISGAGSLSTTVKDAVGAALLGALIALGGLLLQRRLVPRVRTIADLAGLGVPVLLPVLPSGRRPARTATPARLLAARLFSRRGEAEAPVVVVGATPRVGTSFLAAQLATSLAERAPVVLLAAADAVGGRGTAKVLGVPEGARSLGEAGSKLTSSMLGDYVVPTSRAGVSVIPCGPAGVGSARRLRQLVEAGLLDLVAATGAVVVVDAPALSESELGLDLAAAAGGATLVVARAQSRPVDVLTAAELFEARGQRLFGAVLNSVPRRLPGRPRTASAPVARPAPAERTSAAPAPAERTSAAPAPAATAAAVAAPPVSKPNRHTKPSPNRRNAEPTSSAERAEQPEPGRTVQAEPGRTVQPEPGRTAQAEPGRNVRVGTKADDHQHDHPHDHQPDWIGAERGATTERP